MPLTDDKRAVVVGAGAAGLVAAIRLARSGWQVTLIERDAACGGLLRSTRGTGTQWFDHGTHLVPETGVSALDDIVIGALPRTAWIELPVIRAGGYFAGRLNDQTPCIDVRGLPAETVARGVAELKASTTPASADSFPTLEAQLSAQYGATFAREVFGRVIEKRLGVPLSALAPGAHRAITPARLVVLDPETTRELKKDALLDGKLGFHSFEEGRGVHPARYPAAGGTGAWVDALTLMARGAGVALHTSTEVSRVHTAINAGGSGRVVAVDAGRRLECELLVWTLPTALLLRAIDPSSAMTRPGVRALELHHLVFDRAFETDAFYVTCFDPAFEIFRVTLYPNFAHADGHACTVESFTGEAPVAPEDIVRELVRMGIVSVDARWSLSHSQHVAAGFPVSTPAVVAERDAQRRTAHATMANAVLVGKAAGTSFFLGDVLLETLRAVDDAR